jgi:hypothetical protein
MFDSTVHSSVSIHSPAARVFDFLVSPEKIPLVLPGLVENRDIPPPPLKQGSSFHYVYQMYGVMLEGEWTVQRVEAPSRYEATTSGDVASEWNYVLAEQGGATSVQLEVRYETPKTVLQKIKADVMLKINQQQADLFLQNLKTVHEMQT